MNFFPTNARARWLLLLFPFKAYVFLAPVCFMVWELEASEQWVRGAREQAIGPVAMVYLMCLLVFIIAGVLDCFLRNIKLVVSSFLFAVCAFLFPPMIYNHADLITMTVFMFAFGMKLVRDRQAMTPAVQQSAEPFECPECGAIVPVRRSQCLRCAWTYLK